MSGPLSSFTAHDCVECLMIHTFVVVFNPNILFLAHILKFEQIDEYVFRFEQTLINKKKCLLCSVAGVNF